MKRICAATVIALALALTASADEAGGTHRIGLVNVGGVSEPMMGRIAGHLATHLSTAPKMLAQRETAPGNDLQAQATALAPLVKGDVICVIGISAMSDEVPEHGAISPADHAAILNATALKPATGDDESYGQRLEKEALRCAGLLLGMDPCVNLRCALYPYKDDDGLDAKARTYCPPCHIKFQALCTDAKLHQRAAPETR